ncbi:MAG: hypothetical protein R3D70_25215 [Rhizobiaceae bacterium]
MSNLSAIAPRPARISPRVRAAVGFRVRENLSIANAAEKAGLSRNGFAKALRRAVVQDLIREEQERMARDVDHLRAVARLRALEVARDILETGSENAKLRVIDLLLREGKAATEVNVSVDARQTDRGGYEYVRPGQQLVEIAAPLPELEPERASTP